MLQQETLVLFCHGVKYCTIHVACFVTCTKYSNLPADKNEHCFYLLSFLSVMNFKSPSTMGEELQLESHLSISQNVSFELKNELLCISCPNNF